MAIRSKRWLALAVVAVLAGCSGDSPTHPKAYSATGTWVGSSGGMTLRLTLSQSGQSVSGTGNISAPGTAIALTATGTNVSPGLSLTLQATGYEDTNFSGTFVNASSVNGTLNGSGFSGESLTLLKQ